MHDVKTQRLTDKPRSRFGTTELEALLEVVSRARREQLSEQQHDGTPSEKARQYLTESQIRDWFSKERYVYGEAIAKGGMARIFCAADLHLCRTVALKTLLDKQPADNLSRFVYEAQVTAQLQHPNIIPIYDFGQDSHSHLPFFTMKFVHGRSALDIIVALRRKDQKARRQFGALGERLSIFLKASDAIAYAHSLKVTHRDIKPANVMIGEHGEVYVIDWGIAQAESRATAPDPSTGRLQFDPGHIASYHDVYHAGTEHHDSTFLGSPVHMAPEQFIAPEEVDERSDIYGLGCTLYELVTLHPPFDASASIEQLLAAKKRGDFVPAWHYVPALLHDELAGIIHRCMAPRKRQRFQSVRLMQTALKAVTHSSFPLRQKLADFRDYIGALPPNDLTEAARAGLLARISQMLTESRSRKDE